MKTLFVSSLLLCCSLILNSQDLIQNIRGRQATSLNGPWSYIIDPYEMGAYDYRAQPYPGFYVDRPQTDKRQLIEYEFSPYQTLNVPGDWNSQADELLYYEGTIWYRRDFDLQPQPGKRYFLWFGAVNYEAQIFLNDQAVGTHTGGFTAFNLDVTDLVKAGNNHLVVKADNSRHRDAVPTNNTDWWNYGGITRDVFLVELNATYLQDYQLNLLDHKTNAIAFTAKVAGASPAKQNLTLSIPELGFRQTFQTDSNGNISATFQPEHLELWSPDNPHLYPIELSMQEATVKDQIGFRTVSARGTDILINGAPTFLKGVCMHEENPLKQGRANSLADARVLLGWAEELGCNFVRLAHYPHNEHIVRLADQMGILLWSEIPVYWTIDWTIEATLANARQQLREMVHRDHNRASVIIWSIGNETPNSTARMNFMTTLANDAKALDRSRLVSAALELNYIDLYTAELEDPLAPHLDLMSFNEYLGWYGPHSFEQIGNFKFTFAYEQPAIISETGGGATPGFHADKDTRWSEEFQEALYQGQLQMLDQHRERITGFVPWILADFRSPRRPHPKFQQGWNRKGLISSNGEKKKAFYVLQAYYQNRK